MRRRFLSRVGLAAAVGILATMTTNAPAFAADDFGSLGGRLTDWNGEPVTGTQALLLQDGTYPALMTTETDGSGDYSFTGVQPGDYRVLFFANDTPQFAPGSIDVAGSQAYTVAAGARTTVDDALLAPGTVGGRLIDIDGNPLASYRVLTHYAGERAGGQTHVATTDQNGEWTITGVPASRYQISFTDPQGRRMQFAHGQTEQGDATKYVIGAGSAVRVDETWLPETTLQVNGVDSASGSVVSDFCVRVEDADAVCTTTGVVSFPGVPAGPLGFEVETPATSYYLPKRGLHATPVADRTTTVTVPLVLGGKVTTTAADRATGQPVRNACFSLKTIGRPETFGSGCTNAQGQATTDGPVTPGTYEAFVSAPGSYGHQWVGRAGGTGDQKAAARIVVKAGQTVKAPSALLDPAGAITGVVTGVDGAPLANVNVKFRATANFGSGESDGVFTDAAGRYSIGKLGPYGWALLFSANGYPMQWSGHGGNRFTAVQVPVGSTYNTTLTRGSTLRGTITAPAAEVRLLAHNAVTGDLVGFFHGYDGENKVSAYEIPLAGGQQVKLEWNLYSGGSDTPKWHANASDITTATKVGIPASGVKRLNLTYN